MTEPTRMVLVRHGQTEWNREARFRGRAHLPLDDCGLKQARATGRCLAERWPMVAVYASLMRRPPVPSTGQDVILSAVLGEYFV